MATAKRAVPEGFHTVTPQLTLDDAARAIEWYKQGLGAEVLSRSTGPDGRIIHAELRIGNSIVMMNDAMMGGKGPKAMGGCPAALWVYVDDCDALFNRAVAAGAEARWPLMDQFWGDRSGTIIDPAGYQWTFATRKEDLTREEMDKRAQEFFKQMAQQSA